jgi:hypothetical protein
LDGVFLQRGVVGRGAGNLHGADVGLLVKLTNRWRPAGAGGEQRSRGKDLGAAQGGGHQDRIHNSVGLKGPLVPGGRVGEIADAWNIARRAAVIKQPLTQGLWISKQAASRW